MLLNKMNDTHENLVDAGMMILQASDLPFVHIAEPHMQITGICTN